MTDATALSSLAATGLAALLSATIIWAIRPVLIRVALAKPNARSSHSIPTPQGAGVGVITATLAGAGFFIANAAGLSFPIVLFGATLLIAAVGAIDDIRPIPVLPRLFLQAICAGAALYAAGDGRIWDVAPLWLERAVLLFAILWFINLVNFMDGLDLITVAEVLPITAALVALGWMGIVSPAAMLIAAALFGATLGFAPFNKPVAKVFLGDVGSLAIGLMLAWCLIELAYRQNLVVALLLPLYYLSDATLTLLRRLAKREPVWQAHRSHFYQRATYNGFTVQEVVGRVFVLNVCLAALAIGAALTPSVPIRIILLFAGGVAVAALLLRFSRPR